MGRLNYLYVVFDDDCFVYYPGQVLSGRCLVDLNADMKVRSIEVFLRGEAKVHWTETKRIKMGNNYQRIPIPYKSEIQYFRQRQVLLGYGEGRSQHVLLRGYHEFPFSFQLPSYGIPASFEGEHGYINYWIKAKIVRPWWFDESFRISFIVATPFNINEYLIPNADYAVKTVYSWFCESSSITLHAKIDRIGYYPGELITITAEVENLSKRTIMPDAALHQTQTFMAKGKIKYEKYILTNVLGSEIHPRTARVDSLLLQIPTAVSPSITNCSIIKVVYTIHVKLKIPFSFNLLVYLPIVIGTQLYPSQPYYQTG